MKNAEALRAELADRIDRCRVRQFLSVSALSRMTGIPRTSLGRQLRGERSFEVVQLMSLGTVLDVNYVDWLPTKLRDDS